MSDRVSQTIILCEDDSHSRLVRAYMKVCGLNTDEPRCKAIVASREVHGGNVKWVLNRFPIEMTAVRARHKAFARTLLIVVTDADDLPVANRLGELRRAEPWDGEDPVVVLIPRRNIETWIQFAVAPDGKFNEVDDYKPNLAIDKSQVREAAKQIYDWAHDITPLELANIPALTDSLKQWRRIG